MKMNGFMKFREWALTSGGLNSRTCGIFDLLFDHYMALIIHRGRYDALELSDGVITRF
jgi:hypothetical protein